MTNIWILKKRLHNLAIEKRKAKNKRAFDRIESARAQIKAKIEELRKKRAKK